MIEDLASHIPAHLLDRSGKVFYTGRDAFSAQRPIYMLGVNPGGSPDRYAETGVRVDFLTGLEKEGVRDIS